MGSSASGRDGVTAPPPHPAPPAGRVGAFLAECARLLAPEGPRRILAWALALTAGAVAAYFSWTAFDEPARRDGNFGHTLIDFGGQWLMGRMLVTGRGARLYDRNSQR